MSHLRHKWISFFKTITEIGFIEKKHSLTEKKIISLFNLSCLIWYTVALIQIINYLLKTPIPYINIFVNLFVSCCVVISQIIHSKQYQIVARTIFLLCLTVVTFIFSNYLRPGQFAEFFLILVPGISLIAYDNRYITGLIFAITFSVFSIPNIYFQNYTGTLHSPPMICLFFSIYLMFYYFKKNNEENERLLAIERDKVLSDKIMLEKQEAKLRELNEFKTHFFVNLSHEIRTPITLIKGYASKMDFKDSEDENEYKLSIVNNQVAQIENILNNILDLSKLDENKLKLNKKTVSINALLSKHYAEFKALYTQKNIDFNFINKVENTAVVMDKSLVSKAINNLLNNALKFTKKSGKVTLKVSQKKDLLIQVIDNGIGIPEEDLDKIFDRFYQSENDITKSEGSGIGLSFTKSILEAHGFSIDVNSSNISTNFTITIPEEYIILTAPSNTNTTTFTQTKVYKPLPVKSTNNAKAKTILIVDDHQELRHYLTTVLKDYNLVEAENGKEALEILKNKSIDMLVTDYMMPVMDGKELVTQIKKLKIDIPVLMLTARVDDFAKINMLRIGVDRYMIKPFIEEELLLSVKNALKTYSNIIANQKELTAEEKQELYTIDSDFHIKIRKTIEDNIDNFNFGVDDIALLFKVSKSTLNRKIKNSLGQTTKNLIIQARIEKARELCFKNPKMTKKEITNAVGIKNTSYLFKKMTETYGEHYSQNN